MATVKLLLRNPVKNKKCSINYYVSIARGKRIRGVTNIKVMPEYWNPDTQLLRNKTGVTKSKDDINKKLKNFDSFVYDQISSYHTNDLNEIQRLLKADIDVYFNKKKDEKKPLNLLEFYDWYIGHYKANPMPSTGRIMGKGYARTIKNSKRILNDFSDTMYKLDYDKITLSFYDDFITFLTDQDLALNYLGTQIKNLITIMNASFEKDLHQSLDYKKKYFKKPSEEVHNIYLSQKELQQIYDVDLSNFKPRRVGLNLILTKEQAIQAKELFLIGCYTALRVSDFKKMTVKENLIVEGGKKLLRVKSQKSRKYVSIPVHPVVASIIKRNNNEFPEPMHENSINYAIKEIGRLAKINSSYTKEITKGGKKLVTTDYKYKFISTHTARRSFCTNAYLDGMQVVDIMQISNHSTEKVFYNYIKVNDIGRAKKIANHSFFK